jgi:hypothetical protein
MSPRDQHIGAHIRSVAGRTERETRTLVSSLLGRCWPGEPGDRTSLAAMRWVRRWGPSRAYLSPPICGCADGSCAVCN